MRREYYNKDVRYLFLHNGRNDTRHKHSCIISKCQDACDYYYKPDDDIAPLSMCVGEYNYCQCLRYRQFLGITNCDAYECNVHCSGSGDDYGICKYDNDGCYCFDTLNFRNGITKTRWEKIIEYYMIRKEMRVLLLDLST